MQFFKGCLRTLKLPCLMIFLAWVGTVHGNAATVTLTPPCALAAANPSVTICTPGALATLSLPIHVVAGTRDSNSVVSMQLLIDGKQLYSAGASRLDTYVQNLATGSHTVLIKATDSAGKAFQKSINISVTNNAGLSNIRHIIFFVQENHSFDNYFGFLGKYRVSKGLSNNIDGLPLNVTLFTPQGQPVKPFHQQTECLETLVPFWDQSWLDVDGGKMDLFMNASAETKIDPSATRPMGYYNQADIPYYYEVATQFATSDRWFSPVLTQTLANRMYLFAATSFGHIRPDPPPSGGWTQPTIFDALDKAGVSWRYYYQDNGSYLPQWSTYQRDANKMFYYNPQFFNDIKNEATLPQVIFIERAGPTGYDEHPSHDLQMGAQRASQILNALLASPSWCADPPNCTRSSVFIQTYDEGSGFYDHVVPATTVPPDNIPPMLVGGDYPGDFAHTGFRVPVMVVSPWVKPHYVSHTWRDVTSILRLIEVTFNVPPLTARDAAADDMMEFFDFSHPSWLTPPPLPTQPTSGACNHNLEKAPGF